MIERRLFNSLSGKRCDWLEAKHRFSPADADSGWGALRIWNDDEMAPNNGFPPHTHADMETITDVREGAATHCDSLGNTGRICAGDVQVMSAGTGIRHAEFNLEAQTTRIFQIWIKPKADGGTRAGGTSHSRSGSRGPLRYPGEWLRYRHRWIGNRFGSAGARRYVCALAGSATTMEDPK